MVNQKGGIKIIMSEQENNSNHSIEQKESLSPDNTSTETDIEMEEPKERFEVIYSCLRCGTTVSNTELNRLPEIKCICGFRVFIKLRPPIAKEVKAI